MSITIELSPAVEARRCHFLSVGMNRAVPLSPESLRREHLFEQDRSEPAYK